MNILERASALGIQVYLAPSEAEFLADAACNKDVLEVGSFKGLSSYCLATTAKSLLCVDTFKADGGGQTQTGDTLAEYLSAVSRFNNVEYIPDTSFNASKIVSEMFDVIFIDAMHDYENIKNDIAYWLPKLKTPGLMLLHDYQQGFPGIVQAVNEAFGQPSQVVHTLAVIQR